MVLVHEILFLLGHRLADAIGLTGLVAGHRHRDLHDLLLVDDDAIGVIQDVRQDGMLVLMGSFPCIRRM